MRAPAVALATSAALLAACSDAPTRPDAAARPAQAASAQGRTDRHIIVLKQGKEGVSAATSFQTAMQALGGRVSRPHGIIAGGEAEECNNAEHTALHSGSPCAKCVRAAVSRAS